MEDKELDEYKKPLRRARSRYKTIVCTFCMNTVDDACFSWYTGLCICRSCLAFATEEVEKATKLNVIADDLKKMGTKLKVTSKASATEILQKQTIEDIKRILAGNPEPDDIA